MLTPIGPDKWIKFRVENPTRKFIDFAKSRADYVKILDFDEFLYHEGVDQ
jgi:hypothetical protein